MNCLMSDKGFFSPENLLRRSDLKITERYFFLWSTVLKKVNNKNNPQWI